MAEQPVAIYSIGFTKRSAEAFFETLRAADVKRLLDVRLHNVSQLAGYSKRDDLAYFLRELCGADYHHEPLLAPTDELLGAYRKKHLAWHEYERGFRALIADRAIETRLDPALFTAPTALLCSEVTADHCHRRLVLEHLQQAWGDLEIIHL